ncbi:hypothetical protein [Rhodococcus phage RGL3]|uniref:Terminase small subunit n=1 Tax=Rhodococcus phage RGL3 TaxID=2922221 RepID=G9FHQ7_9CAUD|nr:hypothetical protein RoPhRGL3_gp65 [Rhodococcus phage RGL3]AEV52145.1 hypothetical protein [Rhodococcus phage RGL3]
MGSRGPVPKRSEERIRRNQDEGPVEKVEALGTVEVPPLGLTDPHPMIVDLYESLADSAQAKFYEPSDWQYARFTLHFADQQVKSSKPSAQMLMAVQSALTDLLVSEGARRRVRLEIERSAAEGQVLDIASMFREKMQAAQ